MITLLSRLFIPDRNNLTDNHVRQSYGILCGAVGIFLNLCLFTGKLFAGTISNSIAITADAFNNLSDAASSVITMLGFRLAGQKPDSDHPFGHGRLEYISGLLVSVIILLMGFELLKSSVLKICYPEELLFSPVLLVILLLSILVKCYMFLYNRRLGKRINSAAMDATAIDSLSDVLATSVCPDFHPALPLPQSHRGRLGGSGCRHLYLLCRLFHSEGYHQPPAWTGAG